jgi:hypothetical protein
VILTRDRVRLAVTVLGPKAGSAGTSHSIAAVAFIGSRPPRADFDGVASPFGKPRSASPFSMWRCARNARGAHERAV